MKKFVEKKNMQKQENQKHEWKKPELEDVSEKIMAQPYIRFT